MQRQIEELEERVFELEREIKSVDAFGKSIHSQLRNIYISNSELLQRLIQLEVRINGMVENNEDVIMNNAPVYNTPDYLLNECQKQAREIIMRHLQELGAAMGQAVYEALQKLPFEKRLDAIIAIENKRIYFDEFAKLWIEYQYGTELGIYDQDISEMCADDENVCDPIDIYPFIPRWPASSEKEEETGDMGFASHMVDENIPTVDENVCNISEDVNEISDPAPRTTFIWGYTFNAVENNESSDKEDESIKDSDSG